MVENARRAFSRGQYDWPDYTIGAGSLTRLTAVFPRNHRATPRLNGPHGISVSDKVARANPTQRTPAIQVPFSSYHGGDTFISLKNKMGSMGLKPSPRQAVVLQERVQEALHSDRLPAEEKQLMEEFDADLERYLR